MGAQVWEMVLPDALDSKQSLVHNKHHLHGGSVFMDWFIYNNGKKGKKRQWQVDHVRTFIS